LYNNFIRNLHLGSTKKDFDPYLSKVFDDVNAEYFNSMLEKPSLVWEGNAERTLATYNYHDDTIRISNVFKDAPEDIIKFLMYHESLHKLLKFKESGSRTLHHTKQFRRLEAMFKGFEQIDDRISAFLRSKKRKKTIFSFIYDRI
jgi:predicted metal-dependent hydrolase